MFDDKDTIVAIATSKGQGGIGIVRISGGLAYAIGKQISKIELQPRYAHYVDFYDDCAYVVDSGICIYFKAPHSFTGEDIVEMQAHGGIFVLNALVKISINLGARQADPGEFSYRAFLNNKIDLIQAEAISDLINANSELASKAAAASLSGEFSKLAHKLTDELVYLRTYIEASIDFSEEDIDFFTDQKIKQQIISIKNTIEQVRDSANHGVVLNQGTNIVLFGAPNSGKSSLLNSLTGEETAIVTNIAGTTRDILKEKILIDGFIFNIIDTAGIRESTDVIEKIGIERTHRAIATADINLLVVDDSQEYSRTHLSTQNCIIVHNKIDLTHKTPQIVRHPDKTEIYLSAVVGSGVDLLKTELKRIICNKSGVETVFSARLRHLHALDAAHSHVVQALANFEFSYFELAAQDLKHATYEIGKITGEVTTDDILEQIFSNFCVGK